MPTYQYACTECGHAFEQFQSFSEDALTVCPECEGRLRKVFNAVGVVFKGSGFYRNDSRSTTSSSDPASSGSSSSSVDSTSDSTSGSSDSTSGSSTSSPSAPSTSAALVLLVVLLVRLRPPRWSSSREERAAYRDLLWRAQRDAGAIRPSVGACSRDSRRRGAGSAPYATSCGAVAG